MNVVHNYTLNVIAEPTPDVITARVLRIADAPTFELMRVEKREKKTDNRLAALEFAGIEHMLGEGSVSVLEAKTAGPDPDVASFDGNHDPTYELDAAKKKKRSNEGKKKNPFAHYLGKLAHL